MTNRDIGWARVAGRRVKMLKDWLNADTPISNVSRKKVLIWGVLITGIILVFAYFAFGISDEERARIDASIEATKNAEEVESVSATRESRQFGFHRLSKWDGHHNGFERLVKRRLDDPDSMKTIETKMGPVYKSGTHFISMEFRSRNAAGALVRWRATGRVDTRTCQATLRSIDRPAIMN